MTSLHLTVPLGEGESATSFCSRLAMRNFCKSVQKFCIDMRIRLQDVIYGSADALAELAHLGGVDVDALSSGTIRKEGDGRILRGQMLARPMLCRNRISVCPACMVEDTGHSQSPTAPFGRSVWAVGAIRTCPRHNMALIDIAEERDLKDMGGLAFHDFARLVGTRAAEFGRWSDDAVIRKPTALEAYLSARLHGVTQPPTWLDTLPFYAAAKACEVAGAVALEGHKVHLRQLKDDVLRDAGEAGFEMLADGPAGLTALFDAVADGLHRSKGDTGIRTYYGRFYDWLANGIEDPAYEPLRAFVKQHALERLALPPGETILGWTVDHRRLHSVHSAAKETGAHPKRLRRLLHAAGFLADGHEKLSDDKAVFPADARAAEFLDLVREAMPMKVARAYIGAPRIQMELLHAAGLLKPLVEGRHGVMDHAFARRHLDDFMVRLTVDAMARTDMDADMVDIPAAVKRARCTAADVVRLVLDRKLSRVRLDPAARGYMSVLVDPAEVRKFVGPATREGLSITEVQRMTGWSRPVADGLVGNGWLPSRKIRNPVTAMVQTIVEEEDVRAFATEFVSLHAWAKERRLYMGHAKADLDRRGIQPVFDPALARAAFYRRTELPT